MSICLTKKKLLPYPQKYLYQIIADVKEYPAFIPWCRTATILETFDQGFYAELSVGFQLFKEKYLSKVLLDPCRSVKAECVRGPFKYLRNEWTLERASNTETHVHFFLDMALQHGFLQKVLEARFQYHMEQIINAFEKRAAEMWEKG